MAFNLKLSILLLVSTYALGVPAWADNIVVNPDFYSLDTYPSPDPDNFPGQTAIDGWAESNGAIGSNSVGGPFWDNGNVPDASSVGFIQVSSSNPTGSLSQVLNLNVGNTYDYSFLENARAYNANPQVDLLLDDTVLYETSNLAPVDAAGVFTDPFVSVSGTFTATAATQTLEFLATQSTQLSNGPYGSANDASWLITDVSVSAAAPEPGTGSTLLLAGVLAMVGGAIRLRFRKTAVRLSR